jgi:hypothetical protein
MVSWKELGWNRFWRYYTGICMQKLRERTKDRLHP